MDRFQRKVTEADFVGSRGIRSQPLLLSMGMLALTAHCCLLQIGSLQKLFGEDWTLLHLFGLGFGCLNLKRESGFLVLVSFDFRVNPV